jgi:hypothetical protein
MISINITGIEAEISKIRNQHAKQSGDSLDKTVKKIVDDLVYATPVDTGAAREAWAVQKTPKGFRIQNSVPYIEQLNNGHSRQAPSYFIESILLSYGKATGTILTKTPT